MMVKPPSRSSTAGLSNIGARCFCEIDDSARPLTRVWLCGLCRFSPAKTANSDLNRSGSE